MNNFYIIGTPIGNLEDISLRALRILKEVDFVLCEDTRVTKRLLAKYKIMTPTLSYHSFSGTFKTQKILDLLAEGKNLALVSDAGTPTISDPGFQLVAQIREKFGDEIKSIPIPGASALITALSASGLPADQFLFLGFLPHKKGKQTLLKEIVNSKRTAVFYESPHRVLKTLKMLKTQLDEMNQIQTRKIVVAKELTKVHEQTISGNITELISYFEKNPDKIKGEFVFVVQNK
ncbi:MAG: 16S rRNA (cytidine(1402)-2'-O)-methyltransferase [Candidatus Pacebacteria bacterium]|nr:16S rRNA (cytidine(1402)-2'-O)-methyltransferase [Candidatus Paceibacterota bacterium]